jgi:hypothetical protein
MALPWFALSAASSFCVALAFYPALRLPERRRFFVLLFLQLLILLSPLVIPTNARFLRLLGSIVAITFTLKLYDLHIGAAVGARPALPRFVVFLWNVFSLVDRRIDAHPDRPWPSPAARLVASAAATLAALALAYAVFRADWTRTSFALEHAAKVVGFFLVLFPFTAAIAVLWRLFLGPARDHMRNPFAARTPADFWRRYNRPTHEFLEEDVFKPAAGSRRGPDGRWAGLGAIVLTFLLSAVAHEYVFAVPIGRVQGYQTAFFLIQGLAVAATARVKPRGWAVYPWVAATFLFNLATGMLFFASMNHVVRMYVHTPPLWDE